ncbi:Hydrogenase maturation factor HypA [Candidatus Methylobacter favarea]|uniref:Hydrogenase maturation factor HypA n=1 Tax=Candidatus Methylobacter favarea TaxID=2707345 RepID=A0A8S0WQK0_9GAMM|nr:hydrogenase maturation nickel metallochaperone HypA [Candidatus Methylobacter favarea]CAA9891489.1 Hydrogenase maturation factor HypA [Candidatus Methylobacter favarea]
MHELSLLENVREILENHAVQQSFSRVSQVTLEIGKLSCVEPNALRFGFDVVMKGSLAENAELTISEINGLGVCRQCQRQVEMESLYDPCIYCGSPFVKVIQGAEMRIKDLIVI